MESFSLGRPPSWDFMHMVEAVVLHSEKNPEETLKILEQIDFEQISDEDLFRALVGCGAAYLTLGNLKAARTQLEKALRPFSLPAWRRRLSNNNLL